MVGGIINPHSLSKIQIHSLEKIFLMSTLTTAVELCYRFLLHLLEKFI